MLSIDNIFKVLELYQSYREWSKFVGKAHQYDINMLHLHNDVEEVVFSTEDNAVYLIHTEEQLEFNESKILIAFPWSELSEEDEKVWIKTMISKGVPLGIEVNRMAELYDCKDFEFCDEYVYLLDKLPEFWKTVSRQTRKTYNRIRRKHKVIVRKPGELTLSEKDALMHITETWFREFKNSSPSFEWSKNEIYNYLRRPSQNHGKTEEFGSGEFIIHLEAETNKPVAWDYIETHDDTVILVTGHSIITSSFKYITYTLLDYALNECGAKYANIGRTAIFRGRDIGNDIPTSTALAKKFFPHEVQFTLFKVTGKSNTDPLQSATTLF